MRGLRYFLLLLMVVGACVAGVAQGVTLPSVPALLTEPAERADYLALHYWDHFDFKNEKMIGNADVTEQGFSNFLSIMPYVSKKNEAFAKLYDAAGENKDMLVCFMDLTAKYLYEMDSPLYDEELYIIALNQLLASSKVPEEEKERLRYALSVSMKNRVGNKATNFSFIRKDGKRGTLYTVNGDYILLYFNDPNCDGCRIMKEELSSSPVIEKAVEENKLKVLSVCVEGTKEQWQAQNLPLKWIDACDERKVITDRELYDLPSLPVMYLLDRSWRVVQKNTNIRNIEEFLQKKN